MNLNHTIARDQYISAAWQKPGRLRMAYFCEILFINGMIAVQAFEGLNQINRILGVLMLLIYIYYHQKLGLRLMAEVKLFGLFIMWALVGLVVAVDTDLVLRTWRTLAQIWVMMIAIAGITSIKGNIRIIFISTIIGGIILFIHSVFIGDFQAATYVEDKVRIGYVFESLAKPNAYAFMMLLAIISVMAFWKRVRNINLKIAMIALCLIFFTGIVLSGSRKTFFAVFVFFLLWLWFCYKEKFLNNIFAQIFTVVTAIALYYSFIFVLENTFLGERLITVMLSDKYFGYERNDMYLEGIDMFLKYPVTGVGLQNFAKYSKWGYYSHSDYIEVASTTGIIGFILYFSIYIVLLKRINYLKRHISDEEIRYTINVLQVFIITMLILGLGRPNFLEVASCYPLAAVIGYTFYLEQRVKSIQFKRKPHAGSRHNLE